MNEKNKEQLNSLARCIEVQVNKDKNAEEAIAYLGIWLMAQNAMRKEEREE